MEDVKCWHKACGIPKNRQGMFLWISLPQDHPSDVKNLIMAQVGLDSIKSEGGVD